MNHHSTNESKTKIVVVITALTMVIEIYYGISTKSMALLSDGIHMGSHVFAIGLSWLAYVIIRKLKTNQKHSLNTSNLLSLTGYTSGVTLLLFAAFISIEAIERIINPVTIQYSEAILVAIIGLVVNIASAIILHHDHTDHNIKAAYLHVLADTLTSVSAIVGLLVAKYFGVHYLDSIAALISSVVIIKWSINLLKESGIVLLDYKRLQ